MCPTNIKFSWLRMGIQYPEDVPKMEITLEPGIFYSYLTATRMEDVENMEEMEETSMTIPQYVVCNLNFTVIKHCIGHFSSIWFMRLGI
jgi:hypothetical protein